MQWLKYLATLMGEGPDIEMLSPSCTSQFIWFFDESCYNWLSDE